MEKNRKSFMFYLEWENQLDLISDEEKIRFIYNLIRFHKGDEVDLKTTADKLLWNGVLPAIRINDEKYQNVIERNKKNGKLGGRPKKGDSKNQEISLITQENLNNPDGFFENPKNPIIDNSKEIKEKRKEIKEKRKEVIGNNKKIIEKGELETGNGKQKTVKEKIENGEIKTTSVFNVHDVISNSTYLRELFSQNTNDLYTFKDSLREFLNEQKHPSNIIDSTMTFVVKAPSDWKDNLKKIGVEKFIQDLSFYHQDDPRELAMLYAFLLRNLQHRTK